MERRPNVAKDESRGALLLVDVASGVRRVLTYERSGLAAPAFSPDGKAIAFLASDARKHGQIFVMPLDGGDAEPLTATHGGVQQFAWRPSGDALAFITQDDDAKKRSRDKHHDFFDLENDDYLTQSSTPPSHLWLVSRIGKYARRLTSGTWSAATSYPPAPPASPLSWSPDGRTLLFTRVPDTRDGDAYQAQIMRLNIATGNATPLTGHRAVEGYANYSPDGSKIAYLYSRDGDPNNENDVMVTGTAGGAGIDVSRSLDRAIFRVQWFPDGRALLVGSHAGTRTILHRLALDGTFNKIDLGDVNPAGSFWIATTIARDGAIAFPGAQMHHPSELWYAAADGTAPPRLTDLNAAIASLNLGMVGRYTWQNDM